MSHMRIMQTRVLEGKVIVAGVGVQELGPRNPLDPIAAPGEPVPLEHDDPEELSEGQGEQWEDRRRIVRMQEPPDHERKDGRSTGAARRPTSMGLP